MGALSVDLGLLTGFDLHVDAREPLLQVDEVGTDVRAADALFQRLAREARHEAERRGVEIELREHVRDIDALAAEVVFLAGGAVGDAAHKTVHVNHIIDGWVERDSINHTFTSFVFAI